MHRPHLRYKDQTKRERTWTIHLISLEKVLKATIMVVIGVKLLTLIGRDVHEWAVAFVTRHGIGEANKYVQVGLDRLIGVGDTQIREFSAAAFIYSASLYIEGIGLWMQKRWAEYLTASLTALLIPVEIYEIFEKPTWVRVAALGINIFIVWYLVTRLRDENAARAYSPFVKICGITNLDDALAAESAGADALGFNFYPKSKRFITPSAAAAIVDGLGSDIAKIGVFVNALPEEIADTVKAVGLDAVQLHGDETDAMIADIKDAVGDIQLIRAVRVAEGENPADISIGDADAILLDTFSTSEYGGSGKSFDWSVAKRAVDAGNAIYLAGGLGPDNVAEAIRATQPFGVDACSRLESEPGKKDAEKVRKFIAEAKSAL